MHSTIVSVSVTTKSVEKQGKSALGCALDEIETKITINNARRDLKMAGSKDREYTKIQDKITT